MAQELLRRINNLSSEIEKVEVYRQVYVFSIVGNDVHTFVALVGHLTRERYRDEICIVFFAEELLLINRLGGRKR